MAIIQVKNLDGSISNVDDSTFFNQPVEEAGAVRSLGDTLLKFGRGGANAVKAATDALGANNIVSRGAGNVAEFLDSGISDEGKQNDRIAAQRLKLSQDQGIGAQLQAVGKNLLDNPIDTLAEGAGSILPTAAAMLLSKGKINPATVGTGLGVVQGAGAVKGSIYDATKQNALANGMNEQEADALATEAQAYSGENADQIGIGAGLGYLAGKTGAETSSLLTGQAKDNIGLLRSTLKGAATEGLTEGAQGGQEALAANLALQRQGEDVPLMRGVVGQAASEAVAGGLTGGAFGAADALIEPKDPREQLRDTLLAQNPTGALTQAAAKAVETGASDQVLGLPNYSFLGTDAKRVFPDGSVTTEAEAFNRRYAPQPADKPQEENKPIAGLLPEKDLDPYLIYKDGSVGRKSDFDNKLASLTTEDAKAKLRAQLLGYAPQQGGENVSKTGQDATNVAENPNGQPDNIGTGSAGNILSQPIDTRAGNDVAKTPTQGGNGDLPVRTADTSGNNAVKSLNELAIGESTKVGDATFRKTENGFERVEDEQNDNVLLNEPKTPNDNLNDGQQGIEPRSGNRNAETSGVTTTLPIQKQEPRAVDVPKQSEVSPESQTATGSNGNIRAESDTGALGNVTDNTLEKPQEIITKTPLDAQANEAATSPLNERAEPTQAQKDAGNYKVGRAKVSGLDISIENPQGSARKGVDPDGKEWESTMTGHYGYIRGVKAKAPDKDRVDVYVKPSTPEDFEGNVFIVNQKDPKTGKFDEPKVMLGYESAEEAKAAYDSNYTKDWKGFDSMAEVPMDKFKSMLDDEKAFQKPVKATKTAAELFGSKKQEGINATPTAMANDVSQPTTIDQEGSATDLPSEPAQPLGNTEQLSATPVVKDSLTTELPSNPRQLVGNADNVPATENTIADTEIKDGESRQVGTIGKSQNDAFSVQRNGDKLRILHNNEPVINFDDEQEVSVPLNASIDDIKNAIKNSGQYNKKILTMDSAYKPFGSAGNEQVTNELPASTPTGNLTSTPTSEPTATPTYDKNTLRQKYSQEVEGFSNFDEVTQDKVMDIERLSLMDDSRANVDVKQIVSKLRDAIKNTPDKANELLDRTVETFRKQALTSLNDKARKKYEEKTGTWVKNDGIVRAAVLNGAIDVSNEPWAKDYYELAKVDPAKIKKSAKLEGASDEVNKNYERFNASQFGLERMKESAGNKETVSKINKEREAAYDEAAKRFLEGDLTAKPPAKGDDGIELARLENVEPVAIERKVKVAKTTEEKRNVLRAIVPTNDIRYQLRGIHFEDGNAVVTDGHRLITINDPELEKDLPAKPEKAEMGSTVLGNDGKWVDAKFVDWKRVVPEKHNGKPTQVDAKTISSYARGIEKAYRYANIKMTGAPMTLELGGQRAKVSGQYIADMADSFRALGYDKFEVSLKDGSLYATSPDGKVRQVIMGIRDTIYDKNTPAKNIFKPFNEKYQPRMKADAPLSQTGPAKTAKEMFGSKAETANTQEEIYQGRRIYKTKTRDGEAWGIETVENQQRRLRGESKTFGDELVNSIEEARQAIDAEIKRNESNAKFRAEQDAINAKEQAEKDAQEAKKNDIDGFADNLNPMQAAKVKMALDKQIRVNGKTVTVRDNVRELVKKDGKPFVYTEEGKKPVYSIKTPDGVMHELGKTAHDFAQHLINKNQVVDANKMVEPNVATNDTPQERVDENVNDRQEPAITREQEQKLYAYMRKEGIGAIRYEMLAKRFQRAADGRGNADDNKTALDWLASIEKDEQLNRELSAKTDADNQKIAEENAIKAKADKEKYLSEIKNRKVGNPRFNLFLNTVSDEELQAITEPNAMNQRYMAFVSEMDAKFRKENKLGTTTINQDDFDKFLQEQVNQIVEGDKKEVSKAEPATPLSLYDNAMDEYNKGIANVDDYKAAFDYVLNNEKAITEYLEANFTKQQLFDRGGARLESSYKSEKKDRVVRALYSDMVTDFILPSETGMTAISYGWGGDKYADIKRQVGEITQESLDKAMARVQAKKAERTEKLKERMAGIANPQTFEDFNNYLREKIDSGMSYQDARMTLTLEQRITLDNLAAEKSRTERKSNKEAQKTQVQATVTTTTGDIIETKHTKTGEPLFVVKTAERVEREIYNQWNATAKRMGGWYSSFRGNGAVAGFQFKTRENAEAFLKYLGGDVDGAKEAIQTKRNAYADDRSQTAVERLTEMADRLEADANEDLNRDRKTNTARRAGMAARAEANANANKAMAITMRNIAKAIESGSAKYLDEVRQKTQVELLNTFVSNAQYRQLMAKYKSYAEYEKHKYDAPDNETADFAEFPTYTLFRSDWARLGRAMVETDGLKMIGNKILSVANDVTDAYIKFAKDNPSKVGVYVGTNLMPATFKTKAAAEQSIVRSGFNGKAIVIQSKRGEYQIIDSPQVSKEKGVWNGDNDKRITFSAGFINDVVEKIGKANRRQNKLEMPWQLELAYNNRKKLERMGIETPAEMRVALREFISLKEGIEPPSKIKELERSMIGRKNDGLDFFPTPNGTADAMIDAAEIEEGMNVLEPSAGMGHIADRLREAGFEPDVVEFNGDRRELLELKGHRVVGSDFLELKERGFGYGDTFKAPDGKIGVMRGLGGLGSNRVRLVSDGDERTAGYYNRDELEPVKKNGFNSGYDRIIMNPPFSDRRDIAHVMHAYSLLKPKGRIVAIMGEGAFFGSDKKATEFRAWLESVGGTSEKLEEGTFNDPTLPVNTSVNARMVVIDKAENTASFSASPMKSVDANVTRGEQSMNEALLSKADVKRAMYHNELGWIDFVWGDNFKGIQHIIKQRMDKDGLTVNDVYKLLTKDLVDTIASGAVIRKNETESSSRIVISRGSNEAILVRTKGANGWLLTGFKLNEQVNQGGGATTSDLRTSAPILSRDRMVAVQGELSAIASKNVNLFRATNQAPKSTILVDDVKAALKNDTYGHNIDIYPTVMDAPIEIQLQAMRERVSPEGFFNLKTGKVALILENLDSVQRAVQVARHELVGHYGIENMLNDTDPKLLPKLLNQITLIRRTGLNPVINEYSERVLDSQPSLVAQEGDSKQVEAEKNERIAKEVIAMMAEDNAHHGIVRQVLDAIRKFLKKIGFLKSDVTDAEITSLLRDAREYLKAGGKNSNVKDMRLPALAAFSAKVNETLPDTITVDGIERPTLNSNGKPIHPTREGIEKFWKWFGDSKVVDEQGRPLVVYHGTENTFDAWDSAMGNGENLGMAFFSDNSKIASLYAENNRYEDSDGNVMPVYLAIKNPFDKDFKGERSYEFTGEYDYAQEKGNDGLILRNVVDNLPNPETQYVAFNPNQIKSAIGNTGDFNPANPSILFSARSPQKVVSDIVKNAANRDDVFGKAMTVLTGDSAKQFSWAKNIHTQLDKARKDPNGFGRMFNVTQRFTIDMRLSAARPAELMPSIIAPSADTATEAINQVLKGDKSQTDKKAVASFLFEGTLAGESVLDGKVFTDDELTAKGATPQQIKMYREARATINASLDETTAALAYNMARKYMPDIKDDVRNNPAQARYVIQNALGNQYEAMLQDWREMVAEGKATDAVKQSQLQQVRELERMIESLKDVFEHVDNLKNAGYMPLSRFGQYSVTAYDEDGVAEFYRVETEAEAKLKEKELSREYPRVVRGVMPTNANSIFAGTDPDTVSLFLDTLKDSDVFDVNDELFQEWYRNGVSDRSALKRMIHRKGTQGFDTDLEKVLASFLTSNSRFAAQNYNRADMLEVLNYLRTDPNYKRKGDVFDEAKALYDYVNNPADPFTVGRSLMFSWFMGGSVASAAVNMTQPFTMTMPWLSQFVGVRNASMQLSKAMKVAGAITWDGKMPEGELGKDLLRAREIGLVDPQEVHHLYKAGTGGIINKLAASKDLRTRLTGAATLWGWLFGKGEQFNRNLTFIAAWNVAKQKNMDDAFGFARRAVEETQGIYCVDESTQILTKDGWKNHNQLKIGEGVYSIDEFGALKEDEILNVHRFYGNHKLNLFENGNGLSIAVTDDHTNIIQNYNSRDKKWQAVRKVKTKDLKKCHFFLRTPLSDGINKNEIFSDNQVKLLAWVASEGHFFSHRNVKEKRGVGLVQSNTHNPEYVKEIDLLLNELGGEFNRKSSNRVNDEMICWQLRKPLWTFIHEHLPQKRVNMDLVNKLSTRQMKLFLDTFAKGDGTKIGKTYSIGQKSIETLNTLQAMAILSGSSSTMWERQKNNITGELRDYGTIYVSQQSKRAYVKEFSRSEIYVNTVWCPETTNGTWIARRNGRTFITGNSKTNRPNWARGTGSLGTVGAMAFTFKQYSINYIEMLARMARSGKEGKKAALVALGVLVLLSGGMGIPFSDDGYDVLDTALQLGGGEGNTRRHIREFAIKALGEEAGMFALYGVSAFMPLDVQNRMGMGNLIPSTAFFMPSNQENRVRSGMEILGAGGSLMSDVADTVQGFDNGKDAKDVIVQLLPVAFKNVFKGADMVSDGFYSDTRGRKVVETSEADALWKAIGFQPSSVASEQKRIQGNQQTISRVKQKESAIAEKLARARFEGDQEKANDALEELREWNEEHPDLPIVINPRQIFMRLRAMHMTRAERQAKSTPRELRATLLQ